MIKTHQWLILILLFLLVFGTLTVVAHTVFQNNTPGIDYYCYWVAGRAFFTGQDPYSAKVFNQISSGIFGHSAESSNAKMLFANPPYAFFMMLPIIWLDFDWSQAAWMIGNILLMVTLSVILFPKSSRWIRLTFPFFFPFVFGYIMGNFAVTISAFLLIFFRYFIQSEKPSQPIQVLAGLLMAWCTVKPQFIWAFLIIFFLFGLRQRLWKMLGSFFFSIICMTLVSMLFRADWIEKWINALVTYKATNTESSVLSQLTNLVLPTPLTQYALYLIAAGALGFSLYLLYRWWNEQLDPLIFIAWAGFVTYLIHPGGSGGVSYAHAIFVIPFVLWALHQKQSLSTALIWITALTSSYIFDATSLLKTPLWSGQYYFFLYSLWLIWSMVKSLMQMRSEKIMVASA